MVAGAVESRPWPSSQTPRLLTAVRKIATANEFQQRAIIPPPVTDMQLFTMLASISKRVSSGPVDAHIRSYKVMSFPVIHADIRPDSCNQVSRAAIPSGSRAE